MMLPTLTISFNVLLHYTRRVLTLHPLFICSRPGFSITSAGHCDCTLVPNVFQNLTPNPLSRKARGPFFLFSPLLLGEGPGVRSKKKR